MLADMGPEEFTALVRGAVPGWGGTKGYGPTTALDTEDHVAVQATLRSVTSIDAVHLTPSALASWWAIWVHARHGGLDIGLAPACASHRCEHTSQRVMLQMTPQEMCQGSHG